MVKIGAAVADDSDSDDDSSLEMKRNRSLGTSFISGEEEEGSFEDEEEYEEEDEDEYDSQEEWSSSLDEEDVVDEAFRAAKKIQIMGSIFDAVAAGTNTTSHDRLQPTAMDVDEEQQRDIMHQLQQQLRSSQYHRSGLDLPTQLNLNRERFQVMKSVLFEDDDVDRDDFSMFGGDSRATAASPSSAPRSRALQELLAGSFAHAAQRSPSQTPEQPQPKRATFDRHHSVEESMSMFNHSRQPLATSHHQQQEGRVDLAVPLPRDSELAITWSVIRDSMTRKNNRLHFTAQRFSFRAGWGPANVLVHSGCKLGQGFRARESVVHFEKLALFDPSHNSLAKIRSILEIHASEDDMQSSIEKSCAALRELSDGGGPLYELWSLVEALYGSIPEEQSPNAYAESVARKARVSAWLSENLRETDDSVFDLLTRHDISGATAKCHSEQKLRLALVVSQASFVDAIRIDLKNQLDAWDRQGALTLLDGQLTRVYRLLSGGDPSVWRSMGWRRRFGSLLWYRFPQPFPLGKILELYNKFFLSEQKQKLQMSAALPRYREAGHDYEEEYEEYEEGVQYEVQPTDMAFRVMQRFVNPTFKLSKALNPLNFSPCPLDVHASFHLHWMCSRVPIRVGSGLHRGIAEDTKSAALLARLAQAYASQLECMGVWHWAVYVLCRCACRAYFARAVIERHVASHCGEVQLGVLRRAAQIPGCEWIPEALDEARATHSQEGAPAIIESLKKSRNWTQLHSMLVHEQGPLCVILHEDAALKDKVLRLISEIAPHIPAGQWSVGGGVYQAFLGDAPVSERHLAALWRNCASDVEKLGLSRIAKAHGFPSMMADEDKIRWLREQASNY